MPSVLFVCTANRFRSPLAAALFRKAIQENGRNGHWIVDSAGTWASFGLPVLPAVFEFACKYDLDLSQHRSISVNEEILSTHDLTLVMEAGHKEALQNEFPLCQEHIFLLSQVAEDRIYDIMDSVEPVDEVGVNLSELIQTGFNNICKLAINLQKASPF